MNRKKKKTENTAFEVAVTKACEGLFYRSETDAKISPFFCGKSWGGTRDAIAARTGLKDAAEIEERPSADFFSRLTSIQDWFGAAEIDNAKRFLQLQKLLEENLKDMTVLRTGRIQIDIYVVGIDGEGNLAGIRTKAVET